MGFFVPPKQLLLSISSFLSLYELRSDSLVQSDSESPDQSLADPDSDSLLDLLLEFSVLLVLCFFFALI